MNYTENYQLNQWEAADRVLRTDFNADNAKIDAAIKAAHDSVRIVHGSFAGDGTTSRTITLPFAPQILIIGGVVMNTTMMCLMTPGTVTQISSGVSVSAAENAQYVPALNGAQLTIRHADWFNKSGKTTYYTLIG